MDGKCAATLIALIIVLAFGFFIYDRYKDSRDRKSGGGGGGNPKDPGDQHQN